MGDIGVGFKNFKEGIKDKDQSNPLEDDESKKNKKND
jgi:Sec-independent protein translocase protein TatA